jgi:hypothetical protein
MASPDFLLVEFYTLFNKLYTFSHNIVKDNSNLSGSSFDSTKRTFTRFNPVIERSKRQMFALCNSMCGKPEGYPDLRG